MDDARTRSIEAGHELTDARIRPLAWFLVGLGALIVLSLVVIVLIFGMFERQTASLRGTPSELIDLEQLPPRPRLQANPGIELREFQRTSEEQLHQYQWIDRNAGVFRIPIERAMDLVAEQKLGTQPSAAGQTKGGEPE